MTFNFETTEFVDRASSVIVSRTFLFPQRLLVRANRDGLNQNTVIGVVERIVCVSTSTIGVACGVLESRFITRQGLLLPAIPAPPNIGGWFLRLYAVDKPSITQVRFDVFYED